MRMLTDDQMALAFELHYGLNQPWKVVARQFDIDHVQLKRAAHTARTYGMSKYDRRKDANNTLRRKCYLQRWRLSRLHSRSADGLRSTPIDHTESHARQTVALL